MRGIRNGPLLTLGNISHAGKSKDPSKTTYPELLSRKMTT
jgi:hypothetical protein